MRKFIIAVVLALPFGRLCAQDTLTVSGLENSKLLPVLWQQRAAEYEALCCQAFNFANCRLNEMKLKKRRRYAIITDVDETILDNSYFEARQLLRGAVFSNVAWKKWTDQSKATALPGSLPFLQLAKRKGVEIFYISNRDTSEVRATISNLAKLGFPDADKEHMLFMTNSSSKEERRQTVMNNFRVIMMLGDNLNDFSEIFEKKSVEQRSTETSRMKDEWGRMFIVLPNAIYGEWENALYDYKRNLSPTEKEIKLKEQLITLPE